MIQFDEEIFNDECFDAYELIENALLNTSEINSTGLVPISSQLGILSQSLSSCIHSLLNQVSFCVSPLQTKLEIMERHMDPLQKQLENIMNQLDINRNGSISTLKNSHEQEQQQQQQEQEFHQILQKKQDKDLQNMMTLHEAKQRLEKCSNTLMEAAKWEKNVRNCLFMIEQINLNDGEETQQEQQQLMKENTGIDLTTLSQKIQEMRKSLEVLKGMPGADDRKKTMNSICNNIENLVKPKLLVYLREEVLQIIKVNEYKLLLESIGCGDLVVTEFSKSRQAHVHRIWFSFSGKESKFSDWLGSFYGEVLRMVQKESNIASEIFKENTRFVIISLLEYTLSVLQSSFRNRLEYNFNFKDLLASFESTCNFALDTSKLLRTVFKNSKGFTPEEDSQVTKKMLSSIFEPFRIFFKEFTVYASEHLTETLQRMAPQSNIENDEIAEGVIENIAQQLEDSSKDIWSTIENAATFCHHFTSGAAFPELIKAIAISLDQFFHTLTLSIPMIRAKCKLEDFPAKNHGDEYKIMAPDWNMFHASLSLLKATGCVETDLLATESRIKARMREQLFEFMNKESNANSNNNNRSNVDFFRTLSLSSMSDSQRVSSYVVKIWINDDESRWNQLAQFSRDIALPSKATGDLSTQGQSMLLVQLQKSLAKWKKEVQLLTYDTILMPIAYILGSVHKKETWSKEANTILGDLPTFSMLPQEYITTVADLLLSLLPQLETFAQSSSLSATLLASHEAHKITLKNWSRLEQILHLTDEELVVCQNVFSTVVSGLQNGSGQSAAIFVDLWTSVIAGGAMASLLTMICLIEQLSDLGAKQLSADLGYFHNVLNALGGQDNFLIEGLRKVLEMTEHEHAAYLKDLKDGTTTSAQNGVLIKLNECLIKKRNPR